jgi:hypothetical protein
LYSIETYAQYTPAKNCYFALKKEVILAFCPIFLRGKGDILGIEMTDETLP